VEWRGDVDGEHDADGGERGGDGRSVGGSVFVDEGGEWRVDVEWGEHVHGQYDGECGSV
jgi:hypothetical protein